MNYPRLELICLSREKCLSSRSWFAAEQFAKHAWGILSSLGLVDERGFEFQFCYREREARFLYRTRDGRPS